MPPAHNHIAACVCTLMCTHHIGGVRAHAACCCVLLSIALTLCVVIQHGSDDFVGL